MLFLFCPCWWSVHLSSVLYLWGDVSWWWFLFLFCPCGWSVNLSTVLYCGLFHVDYFLAMPPCGSSDGLFLLLLPLIHPLTFEFNSRMSCDSYLFLLLLLLFPVAFLSGELSTVRRDRSHWTAWSLWIVLWTGMLLEI